MSRSKLLIASISAGFFIGATIVIAKPPAGSGGTTPPPLKYIAGYVPLSDGEGLYGGGNVRPASYDAIAPAVTLPVKVNVIGASTAQLFLNAVLSQNADPDVLWGDCSYGGKTAEVWANPNDKIWQSCNRDGFTDPQVVVIKTGSSTATDMATDVAQLTAMVTNAFNKWPTLKQVYLIDEGWLGYYQGNEPAGFIHGQAIKQVVGNAITAGTRFVSWGTYLWANGLGSDQVAGSIPGRADGLEWLQSDYQSDGLHQSTQGAAKQASLFFTSLLADPVASRWFDGH